MPPRFGLSAVGAGPARSEIISRNSERRSKRCIPVSLRSPDFLRALSRRGRSGLYTHAREHSRVKSISHRSRDVNSSRRAEFFANTAVGRAARPRIGGVLTAPGLAD